MFSALVPALTGVTVLCSLSASVDLGTGEFNAGGNPAMN